MAHVSREVVQRDPVAHLVEDLARHTVAEVELLTELTFRRMGVIRLEEALRNLGCQKFLWLRMGRILALPVGAHQLPCT